MSLLSVLRIVEVDQIYDPVIDVFLKIAIVVTEDFSNPTSNFSNVDNNTNTSKHHVSKRFRALLEFYNGLGNPKPTFPSMVTVNLLQNNESYAVDILQLWLAEIQEYYNSLISQVCNSPRGTKIWNQSYQNLLQIVKFFQLSEDYVKNLNYPPSSGNLVGELDFSGNASGTVQALDHTTNHTTSQSGVGVPNVFLETTSQYGGIPGRNNGYSSGKDGSAKDGYSLHYKPGFFGDNGAPLSGLQPVSGIDPRSGIMDLMNHTEKDGIIKRDFLDRRGSNNIGNQPPKSQEVANSLIFGTQQLSPMQQRRMQILDNSNVGILPSERNPTRPVRDEYTSGYTSVGYAGTRPGPGGYGTVPYSSAYINPPNGNPGGINPNVLLSGAPQGSFIHNNGTYASATNVGSTTGTLITPPAPEAFGGGRSAPYETTPSSIMPNIVTYSRTPGIPQNPGSTQGIDYSTAEIQIQNGRNISERLDGILQRYGGTPNLAVNGVVGMNSQQQGQQQGMGMLPQSLIAVDSRIVGIIQSDVQGIIQSDMQSQSQLSNNFGHQPLDREAQMQKLRDEDNDVYNLSADFNVENTTPGFSNMNPNGVSSSNPNGVSSINDRINSNNGARPIGSDILLPRKPPDSFSKPPDSVRVFNLDPSLVGLDIPKPASNDNKMIGSYMDFRDATTPFTLNLNGNLKNPHTNPELNTRNNVGSGGTIHGMHTIMYNNLGPPTSPATYNLDGYPSNGDRPNRNYMPVCSSPVTTNADPTEQKSVQVSPIKGIASPSVVDDSMMEDPSSNPYGHGRTVSYNEGIPMTRPSDKVSNQNNSVQNNSVRNPVQANSVRENESCCTLQGNSIKSIKESSAVENSLSENQSYSVQSRTVESKTHSVMITDGVNRSVQAPSQCSQITQPNPNVRNLSSLAGGETLDVVGGVVSARMGDDGQSVINSSIKSGQPSGPQTTQQWTDIQQQRDSSNNLPRGVQVVHGVTVETTGVISSENSPQHYLLKLKRKQVTLDELHKNAGPVVVENGANKIFNNGVSSNTGVVSSYDPRIQNHINNTLKQNVVSGAQQRNDNPQLCEYAQREPTVPQAPGVEASQGRGIQAAGNQATGNPAIITSGILNNIVLNSGGNGIEKQPSIEKQNSVEQEAGKTPDSPIQNGKSPDSLTRTRRLCVVCLQREQTHATIPCGHLCLCEFCKVVITQCPLCRAEVKDCVKIYHFLS